MDEKRKTGSARLAEVRRKCGYVEAHGRFDGSQREPRLALSAADLLFLLGRAGRLDPPGWCE